MIKTIECMLLKRKETKTEANTAVNCHANHISDETWSVKIRRDSELRERELRLESETESTMK